MRAKKAVLAATCAVVLVVGSVAATVAYLTATTGTVTNAFTVGNVSFDSGDAGAALDEAKVNEYGQELNDKGEVAKEGDTPAKRVEANSYKLIPGQTYVKDPTIHMSDDTEDAWLFVKVDNEIGNIEDASKSIATQMSGKGWTAVDGATGVYAYKDKVSKSEDVVVFDGFTLSGTVTSDDLKSYKDKTIKVQAYAVQAEGFVTAAAAWAAAPCSAWTTAA